MKGSRNFLFAMAAVIIVPFLMVLLPGATPGVPSLFASTPMQLGAISTDEAAAHHDRHATVEGIVRQVYTARSGNETFLDLDQAYPYNKFAVVIFDQGKVGDVSDLAGKTVDITGVIEMYEGKPQIVVSSRDQIAAR